jgi:hypothetical protein
MTSPEGSSANVAILRRCDVQPPQGASVHKLSTASSSNSPALMLVGYGLALEGPRTRR